MTVDAFEDNFLAVDRVNLENLRQMGYGFVDLIVDRIYGNADQHLSPDFSAFTATIPVQGTNWQKLITELQEEILPRCLNLHNPRYLAHMDSVPLAITVWADALIAALNNNMLSHELSPLFSPMELDLVRWFGTLFGWREQCFGAFMAGGSLANLLALHIAKHKYLHVPNKSLVVVPESAHTSFDKAIRVLGLGAENLIRVPCDRRGEMNISALTETLQIKAKAGQTPFLILAIGGTTVTGAFDHLPTIAQIARQYQAWLHLDCAYGGAVIFSKRWRHLLDGSNLADSITFNPQKWMAIARTCAMLLVQNEEDWHNALDIPLPYMQSQNPNLGRWGLQGTRRTDILKVWLALKSLGTAGYAQLIDRTMENTLAMQKWLQDHPDLQLLWEPTVNILCMQSRHPHINNSHLQKILLDRGQLWLSLPVWQGEQILRAVLLHPYSDQVFGTAGSFKA